MLVVGSRRRYFSGSASTVRESSRPFSNTSMAYLALPASIGASSSNAARAWAAVSAQKMRFNPLGHDPAQMPGRVAKHVAGQANLTALPHNSLEAASQWP
jgi:hypothetical protein